ncbi:MAG: histidine phosphatase family protein [Oscillospiraceae bacterium]|nr:histidine phosphatase family protein [Oscillospiraceae bacterium]
MKLIIIRHGDPDYEHDSLTAAGRAEAECLAERLRNYPNIAAFYVSPLGRAQETANYTLEALHRTAETLPWLREFHAPILHPDTGDTRVPWDWLPACWTAEPAFYDKDKWAETEIMRQYGVGAEAQRVYNGLDALLAKHGYQREGMIYRPVRPNNDVIALFCHFGVECVMLGHLIGASPMVLWHGLCAAPTAVTVVSTEERRSGTAAFRINTFGDTGHLFAAGKEPSFSARFCETFENAAERHD